MALGDGGFYTGPALGALGLSGQGRRSDARCASGHTGGSCSGPWAADGIIWCPLYRKKIDTMDVYTH